MRFYVACFGCKVNQYQAMVLSQNLTKNLMEKVQSWKDADVLIVASCVVTEKAENEAKSLIRKAKKNNKIIYVTGCFSEKMKLFLEESNIFFGSECSIFQQILESEQEGYEVLLTDTGGKSRAFVNIQIGCKQYCSYCIVPYARGKSRSRSFNDILFEIDVLSKKGIKEIVLTGTQIGLFENEVKSNDSLLHLMEKIERKFYNSLYRVRLSSIHPLFVSHKILDYIASSKLFCNHLHISLQSGSDKILNLMRRGYTRQDFKNIVSHAKKKIPQFLVSTDIIVGFPGETEEDFEQTCLLAEDIQFSKVHVFPFSLRKETMACHMGEKVELKVIADRKKRLLELSSLISYNLNHTFIGKKVEVLIEKDFTGFTRNYRKVVLKKKENRKCHMLDTIIVNDCNSNLLFE